MAAKRIGVTVTLALVLSILAGATLAILLEDWADAAEGYILVFFSILPAAGIAAAGLLLAGTRIHPRRAIVRVVLAMLALMAAFFVIVAPLSFLSAPTSVIGLRDVKLSAAITIVCSAIAVVQGAVFRARSRSLSEI